MAIEEQPGKPPNLIELFPFPSCKTVLLQILLTGDTGVTYVTYLLAYSMGQSFSRS